MAMFEVPDPTKEPGTIAMVHKVSPKGLAHMNVFLFHGQERRKHSGKSPVILVSVYPLSARSAVV